VYTTLIIQNNVEVLQQARTILLAVNQAALNYSAQIGPHLRHLLDHYECFLDGLEGGCIDYDQRERDVETETHINAAQHRINAVSVRLTALTPLDLPAQVTVRLSTQAHDERPAEESLSSPARELQFLHSHAVHHYAFIRLILQHQGLVLDEHFGKAPSTLRHERAHA
jgi:hypothetical protein